VTSSGVGDRPPNIALVQSEVDGIAPIKDEDFAMRYFDEKQTDKGEEEKE